MNFAQFFGRRNSGDGEGEQAAPAPQHRSPGMNGGAAGSNRQRRTNHASPHTPHQQRQPTTSNGHHESRGGGEEPPRSGRRAAKWYIVCTVGGKRLLHIGATRVCASCVYVMYDEDDVYILLDFLPSNRGNVSPSSTAALNKLDHFSQQLQGLEAQVDIIESTLAEADIQRTRLLEVKDEIAQLNGTLEKLQYVGVDSVVCAELNTGKELAKANRKKLNQQCDELRDRILASQVSRLDRVGGGLPSSSLSVSLSPSPCRPLPPHSQQ